ncbi:MAG: site-specific integrase, partial [Acidobacteriota bacterium]
MPRKSKEKKHIGVFEKVKGSGIFWIRFKDTDGKRKARSVGTFGDACAAQECEKVRIRKGDATAALPRRDRVKMATLCDEALSFSADNHRDSRNFTQRVEVIRARFGDRVADTLSTTDVRDFLTSNVNWSPATRNRYRATLSKVLQLGVREGKVQRNVARGVPAAKEPGGRLRYLSKEEEKGIREGLSPCYQQQLDVALHTGMRKSEQFGLTWDDVDLKQGLIHLDITKNGSSRVVRLNSTALAAMKSLKIDHKRLKLAENAKLFLNDRSVPIADPREWFSKAVDRANVKGVSWHTLRHTFASRLVMAGVDLSTVMVCLGHSNMAMTLRYAHLAPSHVTKQVRKL